MMKKSKNWQNVVQYISATMDMERDAETEEEQQRIYNARYTWLQNTYNLSRKRPKRSKQFQA
jgi:hypothetical protein